MSSDEQDDDITIVIPHLVNMQPQNQVLHHIKSKQVKLDYQKQKDYVMMHYRTL